MKKESVLENSLKQCSKCAKRGKKIADSSIELLRKTSDDILTKLNDSIYVLNEKNINDNITNQMLIEQLSHVKNELSIFPEKLADDVKLLSKKTINITLFGRTMAGKSTLMEILTHGNGMSIGKGYQRTTRDVRDYNYNGMSITDVPGIAAFDGEVDTKIAFGAAKKADLILFLITDDAPQPSEAECLKNILDLGKPVLCLINIKANIDEKTSLKMFQRDIAKKMNDERLSNIKQQFLDFGSSYGQDWSMLKFEFVHLKAAYLSQQSACSEKSDLLYNISRFGKVEEMIAKEVEINGGFYKIKSYIDAVVVPLTVTADTLMQQAANNSEQCIMISDKKDKLRVWLNKFERDGKKQIKSSLEHLKASIKRDVPTFTETHYADKKAGEKWAEKFKKYKVEERCGEILNSLANDCEKKLNDIYREITSELKFNERIFSESNIEMPMIVDSKRILGWGVTLISCGLGIAALFGVPVVGWVALGVGVIGGLLTMRFKSKEKKIAEARKKLENKINENLDLQFTNLTKKLQNIFVNELIKKQVTPTFELMDDILKAMKTMAIVQNQLSEELYNKQEEINMGLLKEAFNYSKISFVNENIKRTARRAGTCMAIATTEDLSKETISTISKILCEKVYNVRFNDNPLILIANIVSIAQSKIQVACNLKEVKRVKINIDELSPVIFNKIKLAQQMSRTYITK